VPHRSYIISCTPRSGSHLLADGLASTGIAGYPAERFPRYALNGGVTAVQLDAMITELPPEDSYDADQDAEYVRNLIEEGTSPNGIFGLTLHWFQVQDAVRRIREFTKSTCDSPKEVLADSSHKRTGVNSAEPTGGC
jgi:LPS sulfotransferase NodH